MTESLEAVERWMQVLLTHPDGPRAGAESAQGRALLAATIPDVFEPSRELSSEARVGVYAGMYFERLTEVLEEEFPGLVQLVGRERAARLFRAYVHAHPSRHYNLNMLGAGLAGFLRDEVSAVLDVERDLGLTGEAHAFAVELARLERTIQDVFDAPECAGRLAAAELAALPPEQWGSARLVPIPALALLASAFPVNAWYQAFRDGAAPPVPARAPAWVAVFRQNWRVWRMDLARGQHALLAALVAGNGLERALGALAAEGLALAEVGPELQGWFRTWAAEGFFARIESGAGA
jgi:hypothetical protein